MTRSSDPRPEGAARLDEAEEGIGHLRREIDEWVGQVARLGPAGAHLTRLDAVRVLLSDALDVLADNHRAVRSSSGTDPYVAALRLDGQVLSCRRILRWFVLRFGQRAEPMFRDCLLGADEVVWSVWRRTLAVAGDLRRPPAPLCFLDNDPVPRASLHDSLPGEARPQSRDRVLAEQIRSLPVPAIALPPVVARRPWWLVTVVHETGHHVLQTFGIADAFRDRLRESVRRAGADASEAAQWGAWGDEVFADGFAAMCVGGASVWALAELERVESDRAAVRPTYPPVAVRLPLVAALVGATKAPSPSLPDSADLVTVEGLLRRIPAVVDAVLDQPVGFGSLRLLGNGGEERAFSHVRWANTLAAGTARPSAELGAAEACVAGAVVAWAEGRQRDPALLRDAVLAVLPACRAPGQRADPQVDRSAGVELAHALIHDGAG